MDITGNTTSISSIMKQLSAFQRNVELSIIRSLNYLHYFELESHAFLCFVSNVYFCTFNVHKRRYSIYFHSSTSINNEPHQSPLQNSTDSLHPSFVAAPSPFPPCSSEGWDGPPLHQTRPEASSFKKS